MPSRNAAQMPDQLASSSRIIGQSACMDRLRGLIAAAGRRQSTVLIHGESGVGKELVAQAIHACSARSDMPFVVVDCTTLRDSLMESQLFGHLRGAFTGAQQSTLGFFRAADGGTLFLDEIGELPLAVQAKLLRVIQESMVIPLGGTTPVRVDVRIVAATHRDLAQMVRAGTFREDLYYRLNVLKLPVPPLRERREDILPIARALLEQQASLYQEPIRQLTDAVEHALVSYHWPGNVRELANAIEHACAISTDPVIQPADLPETIRCSVPALTAIPADLTLTLEAAERLAITRALQAAQGNRAKAAQLLQIERHRLYRKIRRYKLDRIADAIAI